MANESGTTPPRQLPGHIAAALAGAGGATDSAGQPWAGRSLAGDDARIHNFENDDGTASGAYLAAIAELLGGTGDEAAVVASLAAAGRRKAETSGRSWAASRKQAAAGTWSRT